MKPPPQPQRQPQRQRLTALAQHLQRAREAERARLAADLHDELGALLMAAQLDAARLQQQLQVLAEPAGVAALKSLKSLKSLKATLAEMGQLKQRITEGLRPSMLGPLGLGPALRGLAQDVGRRSGLQLHLRLAEAGMALTPAAKLVAYRVAQEALSNAVRHAQAQHLWLTLRRQGARALLTVRDDGRGFVPAAVPPLHHGLLGMRLRAQAEGGRLLLRAAPGRGTRLTLSLPLAAAPPG